MEKVTHPNALTGANCFGRKFTHVLATTAFAISLAGGAHAQDTVTLQYDDGYGVTGEILDFEDNVFRIRSSLGVITIPSNEVTCSGGACPEGTTAALEVEPEPTITIEILPEDQPQVEEEKPEVTLTSLDGQVQLIGRVLEFSGTEYLLKTEVGEIWIDASQVSCEGDGCVESEGAFSFGGDVSLDNGSMTIEGKLVGLEDDAYIVATELLGELRVSSTTFKCTGDGCPPE